jgi:hypothetical protein
MGKNYEILVLVILHPRHLSHLYVATCSFGGRFVIIIFIFKLISTKKRCANRHMCQLDSFLSPYKVREKEALSVN